LGVVVIVISGFQLFQSAYVRNVSDRKDSDESEKPVELNLVEKLQMEKAAHDIDTSKGFEQKTFVSSASQKRQQQETTQKNDDIKNEGFQFGTSIDRTSSTTNAFLAKINEEGLCHPNLYADPKRREEKYLKNLLELRQRLRQKS
jgi:hypothetical protein